jgi:hypothetical protein
MDTSRLPEIDSQYQPRGRRDAGRPGKDGEFKNTSSFKITDAALVYVHGEDKISVSHYSYFLIYVI